MDVRMAFEQIAECLNHRIDVVMGIDVSNLCQDKSIRQAEFGTGFFPHSGVVMKDGGIGTIRNH